MESKADEKALEQAQAAIDRLVKASKVKKSKAKPKGK